MLASLQKHPDSRDNPKNHSSTVWTLKFSRDGVFLFSCSQDESLIVWRRESTDADAEYLLLHQQTNLHEMGVLALDYLKFGDREFLVTVSLTRGARTTPSI